MSWPILGAILAKQQGNSVAGLGLNQHLEHIEPEAPRRHFGPIVTDFKSIRGRMKELGID
jgi:hypothetical protein